MSEGWRPRDGLFVLSGSLEGPQGLRALAGAAGTLRRYVSRRSRSVGAQVHFPPHNGSMSSSADEEPRVFRAEGISYLQIPAPDPRRSAAFFEGVFGWRVDADRDDPSFEDGTGHVIGHFMADLSVAGEAGVQPYVFVERVDETLEKVVAHGGEVVRAPYPEGDLWVATFRDPAGNVIGVWQKGPWRRTE